MKTLALVLALLFPAAASAQQASQTVANQIGQLVIQNANLIEQLQAAQAKVKELEEKYEPKKEAKDAKHQ